MDATASRARSRCSRSAAATRTTRPTKIIAVPDLLSLLATNSFQGSVEGLDELQAQYTKQYGPGNYIPNVFIQYWSMRIMAYIAALVFLFALWGGWLMHRGRLESSPRFLFVARWAVVTPFLMNTAGWMLTENGRQPWIVQGLQKTVNGVSPTVSSTEIWISLIVFVLLYIAPRRHRPRTDAALRARRAARGPRRPAALRARDPRPRRPAGDELLGRPMHLHTLWYVIIAIFWTGFFVLEGFDFGVGVLHTIVGSTDAERKVALDTIGPWWDGNEVWLIVAGAGTFAAFPGWYATMFSALYLALLLVLAGLMARGTALEWGDKVQTPRWRDVWRWCAGGRQRRGAAAHRRRPRRPAGRPADQLQP